MRKYNIDYIDNTGDLCHVWTEASSKSDAIDYVKGEYWNVKEIIDVYATH